MQKDFETLFYEAEDHYLQASELLTLKNSADTLKKRLEIYRFLRDQEISIFQLVADHLVETFPNENPQRLEKGLKHWISVVRYAAMAMLLNNPDYFRHRILEWLTDIVQAQEMVTIETQIFEKLKQGLEEMLSSEQMELFSPFLEQAKITLLETKSQSETLMIGE
ncbi:phycobilisome protein [Cyanothece sp. BG0011]|uniref:phycobilisome protein n=1 Tax=Cyanothece sp. BG0011 TaxID=2082950 RepID=UPI000D1F6456|nr:phycobilisome protein [Cyanothece sp. BG0011]